MKKSTALRLVSLVVAGAAVAGFRSYQDVAEGVTLRLKVEPGQAYSYNVKSESTMAMAAMGREMKTTSNMKQTYAVKKKEEGVAHFEISSSDVEITTDGPLTDDQKAQMKKSIEENKSTLMLDEMGKAKEAAADKGNPSPGGMMNMLQSVSGSSAVFEFPKEAVKVGTSWKGELDLSKLLGGDGPMGMAMTADQKIPITYTVEKIEKRGEMTVVTVKTVIDGKTNLKMSGGEAPPGMPDSITLINKTESVSEVDGATGMLIKVTTSGSNTVSIGAFGDMVMTAKTTMTRL